MPIIGIVILLLWGLAVAPDVVAWALALGTIWFVVTMLSQMFGVRIRL